MNETYRREWCEKARLGFEFNSHVLWGSNANRHPDIVHKILERRFLE